MTIAQVRAGWSLALLLWASGCSAKAAEMRSIPLDSSELSEAGLDAVGQWQSAPLSGMRWLDFRGRSTLRIEHGLGRSPTLVLPYLAFDGHREEGPTTSFLGAGDVAHIADVSDTHVSLINTTNADFYLRIVLH